MNKLNYYFSPLYYETLFPLLSKNAKMFSKEEQQIFSDLNWIYNNDDFEISFSQDESDNYYLDTKGSTIPKRLDKYSQYFEEFKHYVIDQENIGDFFAFVLKKEENNVSTLNKKINSLIEKGAILEAVEPKVKKRCYNKIAPSIHSTLFIKHTIYF